MAKHKSMTLKEYMGNLTEEMELIVNLKENRLLVLILHLHTEYWLNELIIKVFPNSNIILDKGPFKSFSVKLKLLKSLGVISDSSVLNNIETLNRIRNLYTHTLDYKSVEKKAEDEIKKMTELVGPPKMKKQGYIPDHPFTKLQLRAITTILKLEEINRKLESKD